MNDTICFDLTGRRAEAWNQIFDSLTSILGKAIDNMAKDMKPATKRKAKELVAGLGEVTKGWLKAKFDKAIRDDEKAIADIMYRFEEVKKLQAETEKIDIENAIRRVELDDKRLAIWEKRMELCLRWFDKMATFIQQREDGKMVVVISKKDLGELTTNLKLMNSNDE